MSNSPSPRQSIDPLTVGNVISAALRICRDRFSVYYKLAFIACLWLLVPIYGWAKFATISGLISRLTYREIIERPETVHEARRHVNPRLWTFFWTKFLVRFIRLNAGLVYGLFAVIVVGLFALIVVVIIGLFALIFQNNANITNIADIVLPIVVIPLSVVSMIIVVSVAVGGYIWVYSRLSLAEIALAIEERGTGEAIGRSWDLTKGFVVRLQLIFLVAYVLSFFHFLH